MSSCLECAKRNCHGIYTQRRKCILSRTLRLHWWGVRFLGGLPINSRRTEDCLQVCQENNRIFSEIYHFSRAIKEMDMLVDWCVYQAKDPNCLGTYDSDCKALIKIRIIFSNYWAGIIKPLHILNDLNFFARVLI